MRIFALGVVVVCGCLPCEPISSAAPELCAQPDGGIGATQYVGNGSGSASCSAGFDGGLAVFTLLGTSCPRGAQTNPVAIAVTAPCDVSAFPAGVYTAIVPVSGGTTSVTFQLPASSDGGLSACH